MGTALQHPEMVSKYLKNRELHLTNVMFLKKALRHIQRKIYYFGYKEQPNGTSTMQATSQREQPLKMANGVIGSILGGKV